MSRTRTAPWYPSRTTTAGGWRIRTTPPADPARTRPHFWLTRSGERLPVLDLFGRGFVLLTESEAWAKAAAEIAGRLGVPTRAEVVGGADGPVGVPIRAEVVGGADGPVDADGGWRRRYGIGPDGATLVRPDRFIAWRTSDAADAAALEAALRRCCTAEGTSAPRGPTWAAEEGAGWHRSRHA